MTGRRTRRHSRHLAAAGQISRETAVKSIADTYDIADVAEELARIASDEKVRKVALMPNSPEDVIDDPNAAMMAELRARAAHSGAAVDRTATPD